LRPEKYNNKIRKKLQHQFYLLILASLMFSADREKNVFIFLTLLEKVAGDDPHDRRHLSFSKVSEVTTSFSMEELQVCKVYRFRNSGRSRLLNFLASHLFQ
jgi:hypothetical protein